MRALLLVALAAALAAVVAAVALRGGPSSAQASSHREAPLIAQDPTADNTDVYAFRSPDKPNTVTLIDNVIPGEDPAAGPNWYTFSRSAPDYHAPAQQGVHTLSDGSQVFAGQRDDPFFGDIGAVFDLVAIRNGTGATGGGKDFLAGYAVHSIELQVPVSSLDNKSHVIGVWAATDRPQIQTVEGKSKGRWVQVSRLGNPLINELLIPTQLKDKWNATTPDKDKQFET